MRQMHKGYDDWIQCSEITNDVISLDYLTNQKQKNKTETIKIQEHSLEEPQDQSIFALYIRYIHKYLKFEFSIILLNYVDVLYWMHALALLTDYLIEISVTNNYTQMFEGFFKIYKSKAPYA